MTAISEIDAERKKMLDARERKIERREEMTRQDKKKSSYLRPSKVLSRQEFQKYKTTMQALERMRLQKKLRELEKKNMNEQRWSRYSQTRTGKVGQVISRGIQQAGKPYPITSAMYGQSWRAQPPRRFPRPVMTPQQLQFQQQWDYCFTPGDSMAVQVEKEVNGLGGSSYSQVGDAQAFAMQAEILRHANAIHSTNMRNPVADIERETQFFAQTQHQNPIASVEAQVLGFGHILTPRPRVRSRRR